MKRIPVLVEKLQEYLGSKITKEMLLGRGYCLVRNGKVIEDSFPRLKELSWDENTDDEDDKITCEKVKSYLGSSLKRYFKKNTAIWLKGVPAEPEDVDNQEVYMIVCIETKPIEQDYEITNILIIARMVEQLGGGWYSIPGKATIESHFFPMQMVPPEINHEINSLIKGRYIPTEFSLIGKPMPQNIDDTLAKNSGWRNVYWDLSIETDENNIIQDIELSTYEREVSMCQRPHLMDDDLADAFDAALMIVDHYSDEEWKKINV